VIVRLHSRKPHRWFAWRPVFVDDGDHQHIIVWMQWVTRYWSSQTWNYEL
jgi:hypothetical protein